MFFLCLQSLMHPSVHTVNYIFQAHRCSSEELLAKTVCRQRPLLERLNTSVPLTSVFHPSSDHTPGFLTKWLSCTPKLILHSSINPKPWIVLQVTERGFSAIGNPPIMPLQEQRDWEGDEKRRKRESQKLFTGLTFIRVTAPQSTTKRAHFKQILAKSYCCPACNGGIFIQYSPQ